MVSILSRLRSRPNIAKDHLTGPRSKWRKGPPSPAEAESRQNRKGPARRRQQGFSNHRIAWLEPPLPALPNGLAHRIRRNSGNHGPGGSERRLRLGVETQRALNAERTARSRP